MPYDGFVVFCALSREEHDLTLTALAAVWETASVWGMGGGDEVSLDSQAFDRIVRDAHRLSEARYHLSLWGDGPVAPLRIMGVHRTLW